MLESGTGTGAMSHSLMRAVSPSGHLHTFEFNETRATMARCVACVRCVVCMRACVVHMCLRCVHGKPNRSHSLTLFFPIPPLLVPRPFPTGARREEFAKHQLAGLVTVHHADICQDLTHPASTLAPVVAGLAGKMDAVFLDVPKPWLAVPLAGRVLKANAPVATYSPCLEQVFKTCETLRAHGFHCE